MIFVFIFLASFTLYDRLKVHPSLDSLINVIPFCG